MQYMHLGSNFICMMNEIRYILAVMDNTVHQHTSDGLSGSMLVAVFTIISLGMNCIVSFVLNLIDAAHVDQNYILPISHLLQIAAASMAIYVGYRTIKKMDNK